MKQDLMVSYIVKKKRVDNFLDDFNSNTEQKLHFFKINPKIGLCKKD